MSYAGPVTHRNRAASQSPDAPGQATAGSRDSVAALGSASTRTFKPLPRYSTKRDRVGIFAAGVIVGLAVGAGAALLLAPQSGADTRRSIARGSRRLTRNVSRKGHDAWDDLRWELRQLRRQLQRKSLRRRAASSL